MDKKEGWQDVGERIHCLIQSKVFGAGKCGGETIVLDHHPDCCSGSKRLLNDCARGRVALQFQPGERGGAALVRCVC